MVEIPSSYWGKCQHWYFRDHDTMTWGVARGKAILVTELDKSVAAAVACLLNGDIDLALEFLAGLPDKITTGRTAAR